jgi:hypothetical protein
MRVVFFVNEWCFGGTATRYLSHCRRHSAVAQAPRVSAQPTVLCVMHVTELLSSHSGIWKLETGHACFSVIQSGKLFGCQAPTGWNHCSAGGDHTGRDEIRQFFQAHQRHLPGLAAQAPL